jgi:hypothetical protein
VYQSVYLGTGTGLNTNLPDTFTVPCYTPVSPPSLQYVFSPPPIDQSRGSASPPPDSDHEEDIDLDFSNDEGGVSVKVEDEGEDDSIGASQNVRDVLDAWEDLDLNRARSYSCWHPHRFKSHPPPISHPPSPISHPPSPVVLNP